MNIEITKQDAKQCLQSYRKAGIKSNTFTDIGESRAERKEIEMLCNTLNAIPDDNYIIQYDSDEHTLIIRYGTFKGKIQLSEKNNTGTEIQLIYKFKNNNQMDTNTIFQGLQVARQNGTMKSFVKETKELYSIDLSVQGIRGAGHHEGQVYKKLEAFERYAKAEKPQREPKPQSAPKQSTSRVTDPAPSSKQIEERAEAAQNALLQLVNNLNMLNEDKVIELIQKHAQLDIEEVIELIKQHSNSAPKTVIHIQGAQDTVKIDGITHPKFKQILTLLSVGLNPFITGPAGSGKTFTAQQCAKALQLPFYALSLSAQTTQSQIFGYMNANGNFVETDFYKAFTQGGVFCFDEIDNGNANVLAAINSALSNGICSFANGMQEKHQDFKVVATANTIGNGATAQYVGRNQIDKATLDRFQIVFYDYDPTLELMMCNNRKDIYSMVTHARELLKNTKAVVSPRATAAIYKLTSAGMDINEAFELSVVNKLSDNEKAILC
jgi:AAA domain (dynein-related subfamily)